MTPFLTREEVKLLSARQKRSAILRSLDRMGVQYVLDGDGWPLVPRSYLTPGERVTAWGYDAGRVL